MQESNIAFNVSNGHHRFYLLNEYLTKCKLIINIYLLQYY